VALGQSEARKHDAARGHRVSNKEAKKVNIKVLGAIAKEELRTQRHLSLEDSR
jgi:hypothetical protein